MSRRVFRCLEFESCKALTQLLHAALERLDLSRIRDHEHEGEQDHPEDDEDEAGEDGVLH